MSKIPPIPDFDAMTPEQRDRALQALCDAMDRYAVKNAGTPHWHAEILAEREAGYRAGKVKAVDWEEAKKTLRKTDQ